MSAIEVVKTLILNYFVLVKVFILQYYCVTPENNNSTSVEGSLNCICISTLLECFLKKMHVWLFSRDTHLHVECKFERSPSPGINKHKH